MHGKLHVEDFCFYAPLAVNLHVYAIDEDDRVIRLQRVWVSLQDILANVLQYPRNARLAIVLAIDLEYLACLFLCKTFRVKRFGKVLAFIFLMAQDRQDSCMKVPVAITWYPGRQHTAINVTMPRSEAVAFVP